MSKPRVDPESLNHDSFLDIVANLVGIMIILVMVVGMRVRNAPVPPAAISAETAQATAGLQREKQYESAMHADVLQLEAEIASVGQQIERRGIERQILATSVAAMKHELESLRGRLDGDARATSEMRERLAEAERGLNQLQRQRAEVEAAPATPTLVKNYPTPLSRMADENEAHFQLRGGRVAYVPLDALLAAMKRDAMSRLSELRRNPEVTDTIGPIEGFRMRYTMALKYVAAEYDMPSAAGAYAQLQRFLILPVSSDLGEPVEEALRPESAFHRCLSRYRPGLSTLTFWVSPDSFPAFRRLREVLYEQGYAVAARPLTEGMPISGSPDGSKSAAQ